MELYIMQALGHGLHIVKSALCPVVFIEAKYVGELKNVFVIMFGLNQQQTKKRFIIYAAP